MFKQGILLSAGEKEGKQEEASKRVCGGNNPSANRRRRERTRTAKSRVFSSPSSGVVLVGSIVGYRVGRIVAT